jgi:dehydrogenase/reductase SDR family protein 12
VSVYFYNNTILNLSSFFVFSFSRNHMKRFKEDDVSVDMTGKNCIVTGANSGIGYETAKSLAARYI